MIAVSSVPGSLPRSGMSWVSIASRAGAARAPTREGYPKPDPSSFNRKPRAVRIALGSLMYRWFIAHRYLFSRIITFAALLVVASSVSLLIVIISVMEGFRSELQQRIRGTSSDLKIESKHYIALHDPTRVSE